MNGCDRMRTIAGLPLMPRLGYALGFLACAGLLGYALYLQYYQDQNPCPLCILQRTAYITLMAIFLVAALHGPGRIGTMIYGVLLLATTAAGAAVAGRHVWLQYLPKVQVPECGPGLEYMLNRFPFTKALEKILSGSGECAEVGWRLMGLSLAEWSLAWLVLLSLFVVYLTWLGAGRGRGATATGAS